MSRAIRSRLQAALRPSPAGWLETVAVLRLPLPITPWTPDEPFVEALTATVWARLFGHGNAHAIVRTYHGDGMPVLAKGTVSCADVVRLGGLCDKPHRIMWLSADVDPQPVDTSHRAVVYHQAVADISQRLADRYGRLLHRRFLRGQQVRVRATPAGGFAATVPIDIEPGPYQRADIAAHTAALSGLLRRFGPGGRLRFHPPHHRATDLLHERAWRHFHH